MKQPTSRPPNFFLRFFRWFCDPELRRYVEGDLMELFGERVQESGARKARLRFMLDVLLLFRPGIIRPIGGIPTLINYGMFSNYLKISIRNLLKYKVFSFINISGLAVAMSVCLLIILMLVDQLSYDQFHRKGGRIYRVITQKKNSVLANASTPYPLASKMKDVYPFVENAMHLVAGVGGDATYEEQTTELRGFFAEPSFFDVFDFELEQGNKRTALEKPNSIVISTEVAQRLFGANNPVGKVVEYTDRGLYFLDIDIGVMDSPPVEWGLFTVTGVFDPNIYKSHLTFSTLMSAASLPVLYETQKKEDLTDNWQIYHSCYTYLVLKPGENEERLSQALNELAANQYAEIEHLQGFRLIAQHLSDITPGRFLGNATSLTLPIEAFYFLGFLALIIMLSACLNYTNLSTARALTRAKEIGVRKVAGATRSNLIYQFVGESILTSLLALIIAVLLLSFVKHAFMGLWINQLFQFDLHENLSVYLIFIVFALLIGILAGTWPAFRLSRFQPIQALKSLGIEQAGKLGMRKLLGVSQFVVSLFFIITTLLISNQFQHFLHFDYGFSFQNIVNVELKGNDYSLIKQELSSIKGVTAVSACEFLPATGMSNGISVRKVNTENELTEFELLRTDEDFIGNLGIELIAGRSLPGIGGTVEQSVLLNKTAIEQLGYLHAAEAIGQDLETEDEVLTVIGVVSDFQSQTPWMQDQIGPVLLRNQSADFSLVNVKIASGDLQGTLARMEQKWKTLDMVHPFTYYFFDEQLAQSHQMIGDLVSILGFISFLAIFIACLGLLGMATFSTERRMKEVGIRKILGAGEFRLIVLLSREFLTMLALSVLIAAPLSYFINNLWLEHFPNRVEFSLSTLFTGIAILVGLGLLTIGSQTLRASRSNPVDSLRSE